jgi:hypothetical protein
MGNQIFFADFFETCKLEKYFCLVLRSGNWFGAMAHSA